MRIVLFLVSALCFGQSFPDLRITPTNGRAAVGRIRFFDKQPVAHSWNTFASDSMTADVNMRWPNALADGCLGNVGGVWGFYACAGISSGLISVSNYTWSQSPAGTLSAGDNLVTLAPVPLGVNWNNGNDDHKIWVAGTGTPEDCVIKTAGPGTATSGASTGNLTVTCAGAHSAGYTMQDAFYGVQEAIYSAGAGSQLTVPAGNHNVYAPVTIPYSIALTCAPGAPSFLAQVATQDMVIIKTTTNTQRVRINNCNLSTSVTKTAGDAIRVSGSGGVVNSGTILDGVSTEGQYNAIHFESAAGWYLSNFQLLGTVNRDIFIENSIFPDSGDGTITTGSMDNSVGTGTAIRYESAGGVKISGIKILNHQYGIDLAVADGVSTSDFLLTNSSIEGSATAGIRVGRAGTTGLFYSVIINGNEVAGSPTGILVQSAGICGVSIANNIVAAVTTGIEVGAGYSAGCANDVSNNYVSTNGTGDTGIKVSASTAGLVRLSENRIINPTVPYSLLTDSVVRDSAFIFTYATLPSTHVGDFSQVTCYDCNDTCTAGGGSPKMCARENGAWKHPVSLILDGPSGATDRYIPFTTSGSLRMALGLDGVAESGSDSGSNIFLNMYDDAGAFVHQLFSGVRATGAMLISKAVVTDFDATGGIKIGGTLIVNSSRNIANVGVISATTSINTPAFRLSTGGAANYLAISDASGNMAWASPSAWGTDFIPATDNTYDQGTLLKRWKTGYFVSLSASTVSATSVNTASILSGISTIMDTSANFLNINNLTMGGILDTGSIKIGGTLVINSSRDIANVGTVSATTNINTPAFRLSTGGAANYIAISDASGNMAWASPGAWATDFIPATDNTYDQGTLLKRWKTGYYATVSASTVSAASVNTASIVSGINTILDTSANFLNINNLTMGGVIKITGGSPGAGKVLTSDSVGLGSWQTPSVGMPTSGGTFTGNVSMSGGTTFTMPTSSTLAIATGATVTWGGASGVGASTSCPNGMKITAMNVASGGITTLTYSCF